ncbi:MAG: hypothetical protein GY772_17455 [bacterium]|nr:hypothetical protein [bacterium]
MSRTDYDAFGDVRNTQTGIFGSEQAGLEPALRNHDAVTAKPTSEGLVLQMTCQGCGVPTHITAEWPEVVALKYGVNPVVAFRQHRVLSDPTPWEFLPHEHAWRPALKCSRCSFNLPVRIEPHEPEKHLAAARRAGFINRTGEDQVSRIAASVSAQQGRQGRR